MNLHLAAGCAYLVLNTLLPWAVAIALWRRFGQRTGMIYLMAPLMLALAFTLGGLWYTVIDELLFPVQRPGGQPAAGYHPVAVFVLCGGFSVGFFLVGSLVVVAAGALWEKIAPASLDRLTRCKFAPPRAPE